MESDVELEMEVFALLESLLEVEFLNFQRLWTLLPFAHIMISPFAQTEEIRIQEICAKL